MWVGGPPSTSRHLAAKVTFNVPCVVLCVLQHHPNLFLAALEASFGVDRT